MNPIKEAVEAAVPGLGWIKPAGIALAGAALIGLGWAAHDAFDGTKAAKADTVVAQTQLRCETARADSNGAAAGVLATGGQRAADADHHTATTENPRQRAYQVAQQEASHASSSPDHALCIDPEPLRRLFIGMRDGDAAAAAAGADGGGDAAAAVNRVPGAAGD